MNWKRIRPLYAGLIAVRKVLGRAYMRQASRSGTAQRKVFFSSFKGKAYSDSPRAVSEALQALRPDIDIVWQVRGSVRLPQGVRAVRPHTLAALREIATARCVVDNFNRPAYMRKSRGQLYVQTWHGDRGFKKMLYDLQPEGDFPDGAQMDLAVAGSDFGEKLYRSAFRYAGEVLKVGMPRNDALVNATPKARLEARRRVGIASDAKILLYAPTFREATVGGTQPMNLPAQEALDALERATGERWRMIVRAHDLNRGMCALGAEVADLSDYPEMTDLLLCADLLITDYSSCAGDFILTDRPVILYQPDFEKFIQQDRELYFDLQNCPYARAETPHALLALLEQMDAIQTRNEAVRHFYGVCETGRAAQTVAEWISARIKSEQS
ncbi:MAG: CDP-glycerol glycerophosphotransferase family protein [Clostridia bacterium]|nr:CDP-glycerol glycerophosphotransferase family protein [Clostridia bacterium]